MYFCHKYREIYNMNSLIFPPYVHEGDRVIILSPSSKIDKSFLKGAKKRLKSWGLDVASPNMQAARTALTQEAYSNA